jgi:hypothetical protein
LLREFVELAISGWNYLTWALDAKIMLGDKNILKCIEDPTIGTSASGNSELPAQVERN